MTRLISHWIDGRNTPGTSGRTAPVYNPATGQRSAEVELASESEVTDAVAKAVTASKDWRHASLSKRSGVLFAFRERNKTTLAASPTQPASPEPEVRP